MKKYLPFLLIGFAVGLGAFYIFRRKSGNPSRDIRNSNTATAAVADQLDPQAVATGVN